MWGQVILIFKTSFEGVSSTLARFIERRRFFTHKEILSVMDKGEKIMQSNKRIGKVSLDCGKTKVLLEETKSE